MEKDSSHHVQRLKAKSTWIFDLDNTLYPSHCNLFSQIDQRMGAFISDLLGVDLEEARRIQKTFFMDCGTTLKGLMANHDVTPREFLDFVHDIDMSPLEADPGLRDAISALDGRCVVYTNADQPYAARVLERIGIADLMDGIFAIEDADFIPKPHAKPYAQFVDKFGIDPAESVMVEDMARNLKPAHSLGMTTVWIENQTKWGQAECDDGHIHHSIGDLSSFLRAVARS